MALRGSLRQEVSVISEPATLKNLVEEAFALFIVGAIMLNVVIDGATLDAQI